MLLWVSVFSSKVLGDQLAALKTQVEAVRDAAKMTANTHNADIERLGTAVSDVVGGLEDMGQTVRQCYAYVQDLEGALNSTNERLDYLEAQMHQKAHLDKLRDGSGEGTEQVTAHGTPEADDEAEKKRKNTIYVSYIACSVTGLGSRAYDVFIGRYPRVPARPDGRHRERHLASGVRRWQILDPEDHARAWR